MPDYIIIGAGSAGCVIASRLSEDPGTSVLLLEAGGPDTKPEIHEASIWPVLLGSDVDWAYSTEDEPHLGGRRIAWPRGKVLGGSSAINAMLHVRGHRLDFDHWSFLGNQGWSHDEVLPWFKRSERYAGTPSAFRGERGPLHVSEHTDLSPHAQAFLDTAASAGHARNPDYNGAQQEGVAPFQYTIKDGKRQSTAVAFLRPALGRANLAVETRAQVTRLITEGMRVVGVEYVQDGKRHQARAEGEVIVSAGAVGSPGLLMCSGIGPAEHLRALDVPVVVDVPGVGENLQDHPMVLLGYQARQPIPPAPSSSGAEVNLFAKLRSRSMAPPEIQVHMANFLFFPPEMTQGRQGCTIAPVLCRPLSRGRLRLRSTNPADAPLIQAGYLACRDDEDLLVEGVRMSRALAHAPALEPLWHEIFGPAGDDEPAVRAYVRQALTTIFHPVGTCKMGLDRMAVVDPALRVHGVQGLRVADASIMPQIVTANTNAATIMIGEKAAGLIRGVSATD